MGPSKKNKASELGVTIISENELQDMVFPKKTLF